MLADEIAFWYDENSANPDEEVLVALRPGLITIPGAMLLCASSPLARKGALWQAFERWHGQDDAPALIWRASTRTMNPSVPEEFIARELDKDQARAAAEYLAEFRTDVENFIGLEAVRACIEPGCRERGALRQWWYHAFVDPSGGSNDAMTLAIAHKEGNTVILDMVRERRPPFSPEALVEEFANELKNYRITTVAGDRYAGEWPRERFRLHGVNYEVADKSKSELYVALLPSVNSRAVDLLDDDRLVNQLVCLERTRQPGRRRPSTWRPGRPGQRRRWRGLASVNETGQLESGQTGASLATATAVARRYAGQWVRMDGSVTCLSALAFPNWDAPIDVGEAETAAQAWQKLCNLQRSDEVIRFIKVISGGTSLERGDYFVAVAASCGRWRVEGRESRRADTRRRRAGAARRLFQLFRREHTGQLFDGVINRNDLPNGADDGLTTACSYRGDLNDLFRIDDDFVGPFIRLIPPGNLDELRHFKILLVRVTVPLGLRDAERSCEPLFAYTMRMHTA